MNTSTEAQTHARSGRTRKPRVEIARSDGLSLRIGDKRMARRNNRTRDGSVTVTDGAKKSRLPADYVTEHTHLAYASTVYGVQAVTVGDGHGMVTDSTSAQGLYVAATRGRERNIIHVVAGDVDEARTVFSDALGRESGDRGVEASRAAIYRDVDGVVLPQDPPFDAALRDERHAHERRAYTAQVRQWELARETWETRNPGVKIDDYPAVVDAAVREANAAAAAVAAETAAVEGAAVRAHAAEWERHVADVRAAAAAAESASPLRRRAAAQAHEEAVRAFRRRHNSEPVIPVTAERMKLWAQEATQPGASAMLDQLRKDAGAARRRADQLQQNPPPRSARPQVPTIGTPVEEVAKDEAFRRRRDAAPSEQARDAQIAGPVVPRGHEFGPNLGA